MILFERGNYNSPRNNQEELTIGKKKRRLSVAKISLIIIEDQTMLRQTLVMALTMEGFDVSAHFAEAAPALQYLSRHPVDVAVVDYNLPGMDGPTFTRRAREMREDFPIVILSLYKETEKVRTALDAGVLAYIPKDATMEELTFAIHKACQGEIFVSPGLTRKLLKSYSPLLSDQKEESVILSPEHILLLRLTGEGFSVKEIAEHLAMPVHKVKHRFADIFRTLQARDRAQALFKSIKMGLLKTDEQ